MKVPRQLVILLAIIIIASALALLRLSQESKIPVAPPSDATGTVTSDDERIAELFRRGRSGEMVEAAGVVERVLSDDLEGSRHQRFVVRLRSDHTLLISHNIDLADRVPLAEGDSLEFRGQYEWNDRGGVVHWTHHDPDGRRAGGWLRHRGKIYR